MDTGALSQVDKLTRTRGLSLTSI